MFYDGLLAATWKRTSRIMSTKTEKRKENDHFPFPRGNHVVPEEYRYKDYQNQNTSFRPVYSAQIVTNIQLVDPGDKTAITHLMSAEIL